MIELLNFMYKNAEVILIWCFFWLTLSCIIDEYFNDKWEEIKNGRHSNKIHNNGSK